MGHGGKTSSVSQRGDSRFNMIRAMVQHVRFALQLGNDASGIQDRGQHHHGQSRVSADWVENGCRGSDVA